MSDHEPAVLTLDPSQADNSVSANTISLAETHVIKARAVSGIKALMMRTGLSVLLRIVSSLCLAHFLFPKDYGVFGVAAYIAGLGLFLCDVGLGGALVRQHRAPTRDEAFSVFVSQQMITAVVVSALIAALPWLIRLYHLSSAASMLLIVMSGGLFLSSLRVIPMMALERELRFGDIARCEMIENLVQTGSAILLAWLGTGAWALAGSGLLRGVVGLVIVWMMSPWRPHGRFRWEIVTRLARFGIPFQLNALAPTLLGGWMPLVVSRLLGVAALGLVNWAGNIASVPMMLSGVLNRVAFPALSRMQGNPKALADTLRASLRRLMAILCLVVPLIVIFSPVAIPVIFGHRWTGAILLVQWFSFETLLLTLNGLMCAAQNATGHAGDRLGVAVGIGLLRWGVGYAALRLFGLSALGPAVCAVSGLELLVSTCMVRRRLPLVTTLLPEIFKPLLITSGSLGLALTVGAMLGRNSWYQMAIAFLTFGVITFWREWSSKSRPVTSELRGVMRMLRPAVSESVV